MKRHIFLSLMACAPLLMMAQPPAPDVTVLKDYLNLTDTQMTSLDGVMRSQHDASRSLATQAHSTRQAFDTATHGGTTDAATLGNLMLAMQASEKKVQALHAQYQQQAVSILTSDQQAKLKVLSDAAALGPQIHQAAMLGLISPPPPPQRGGGGPGGPGGSFARAGRRAPGGPPPPRPEDQ